MSQVSQPHQSPASSAPIRRQHAFTLTELLVIIALVAVLASLRLTAVAAARDKSVRVRCLNNVKQCASGMVAIALDNNNQIPALSGGNWPLDIPSASETLLVNNGLTRDLQYDPANLKYNNNYNFAGGFAGYSSTGYAWSLNNLANPHAVKSDDQNASLANQILQLSGSADDNDPQLGAPAATVRINNSKRVLLACMVLSPKGSNDVSLAMTDPPAYSWGGTIAGGPPSNYQTPYGPWPGTISTSHLSSHNLPEGGNEGLLDGRAKWYPFSTMRVHTTIAGNTPTFWWNTDPSAL